jgi:rhodanese-related sulfurtransferase/membrane protein insertase Oxa1/YidC/SpoIIIJ/phosphohistidine swiveling domain-containing protein
MRVLTRRVCLRIGQLLTMSGAIVAFGSGSALAIPSPELVVGSLSSISQIVALAFATLGGGAALVGARVMSNRRAAAGRTRLMLGISVAALLALIASIGVNFYQYSSQQAALQERLEATLIRPTPLGPDGKPLDDLIREPAWTDQLDAPNGLSSDQLEEFIKAKQRGEHQDVEFYDIREASEIEMGTPPGASPLRFADISSGRVKLTTKKAVLVCHTGIRSYDMCQRLKAMGIDCQFMVGGIEKWITERRPLTGKRIRTLKDLRALPPYRNQAVLLDTPDVRRLLETEDAIIVDPRLPGEFKASHLPNAINFTLRQTPQEKIPEQISLIPRKPVIIPCYDRRSCFYAEALGLEFARAGYDFRGRYTVPWDYFVKPPLRPFIKKWLDELNQTWWDKAVLLTSNWIGKASDQVGLLISILLLAALSRLIVLPFSVKAERDQIATQELAAEVAAIKAKYGDDSKRRLREMRAFYLKHNLTPIRNMFGLLFLPLMALCVAAIGKVATQSAAGLLWLDNAGEPDPGYVLPVIFAVLICAYLHIALAHSWKQRTLVWLLAGAAFVAIGSLLNAAADIYMIASIALLLVQRFAITGTFKRLLRAWQTRSHAPDVVPLSDVNALAACGNKSYRLGQLQALGLDVPEGAVLTQNFLDSFKNASPAQRQQILDRIWRQLGAGRIAVRSSSCSEDGKDASFAGIFESVLDVDREHLEAAILQVLASFDSERAKSYGVASGPSNILLQHMVGAEFAGVLFTRDPASAGHALIELVHGTADKLVGGLVPPETFRIGRLSGNVAGPSRPPIDLKPLAAIGRRVEAAFGTPQDIEWAYQGSKFHLVQSRDITRPIGQSADQPAEHAEWDRVFTLAAGSPSESIIFAQNEISEVLPRPTPLSLSLMQSLWANGGSVDLACEALQLSYQVTDQSPAYPITIFGRTYVDRREEQSRALIVHALAKRRLRKSALLIESEFREHFLPRFRNEITLLEATDFNRLTVVEIINAIAHIRNNFVTRTQVEVEVVNIAAELFLREAKRKLTAARLDPLAYLAPKGRSAFENVLADAAEAPEQQRSSILEKGIGHRAPLDYELSQPRYGETPRELDKLCIGSTAAHISTPSGPALNEVCNNQAVLEAVDLATRFQTLKEDAKHDSLRELAVLRRAILALDRKLDWNGLVFYLTIDDLVSFDHDDCETYRPLASEREAHFEALSITPPLPARLSAIQLEEAAAGITAKPAMGGHSISGTRVAGTGIVEGRARVVIARDVESTTDIPGFLDGDIVVSKVVLPDWIPYFGRAGGFVCEVGGWLSHTAIVARERNVALIVGADGIESIIDGMQLRLHPSGGIEIIEAPLAVAAE